MRRLGSVLLVAAVSLAACADVLPVGPTEVVDEVSDELFTLVVRSPSSQHRAGQPIDVAAELIYQGPRNRETIYHAASPIGWRLQQVDGPAAMEGAMAMPCATTDVTAGAVNRYAFQKGGAIGEAGPFDAAWYSDPTLTLPPGRWRVIADMNVDLGDCGGESHALQASIELVVTP